MPSAVREVPDRRSARVAYAGTCLLLLAAPFEPLRPLITLPGQSVTAVEAAIALAVAGWIAALVFFRERPVLRTDATMPWVAWLATAWTAAWLAPAFQLNAFQVAGRLSVGLVVFLLAVNGVTSARRVRGAIAVALTSGTIVAAAATLEYFGQSAVLTWLEAFREDLRLVGGQVRASGTLQYPTITSMYLEIVFALGLGGFLAAVDSGRLWSAAVVFVGLAAIGEGVFVTLTRAGLLTLAASLLVVGAGRYRRAGADRGLAGLAALAVVVVLLGVSSASAESLRLRLTTEGYGDWYRASFLAPASLSMRAGSTSVVEVEVVNKGRITWDPAARPAFYVSYHWFDESMSRVVAYDGLRTPLGQAVSPGGSLRLGVRVRAPKQPGRYTLGWDVVQEKRLWFSAEPGARQAITRVTVDGPGDGTASNAVLIPLPVASSRIGRPTLWNAAVRMAAAHPVLGVGPDNFRWSYGPYARVPDPDHRVTSNNTYLEVLTGTGVLGLAAFLWLAWRILGACRDVGRRAAAGAWALHAGVAAALVAVALHGLLDSFLTLTPTYLTMSLVVGLAIAPAAWDAADLGGANERERVSHVSGAGHRGPRERACEEVRGAQSPGKS
jgi:hypothetical protein